MGDLDFRERGSAERGAGFKRDNLKLGSDGVEWTIMRRDLAGGGEMMEEGGCEVESDDALID